MNKKYAVAFIAALVAGFAGYQHYTNPLRPVHMKDEPLEHPLPINTRPKVLAIGDGFSVGVKRDGTVWTWGTNNNGILARPLRKNSVGNEILEDGYNPGQVPGLTDVVEVAAGNEVILVLKKDGTVWSWGDGDYGALGYEINKEWSDVVSHYKGYSTIVPRKVKNLPPIKIILTNGFSSTALDVNGNIWSWGRTLFGSQSGDVIYEPILYDSGNSSFLMPQERFCLVNSLTKYPSIADINFFKDHDVSDCSSSSHILALENNGRVWSWGGMSNIELGRGNIENSFQNIPGRIESLSRINLVHAGLDGGLASDDAGGVYMWGRVIHGLQLSPEQSLVSDQRTPFKISGSYHPVQLASSGYTYAMIEENGKVWFWGQNRYGERGIGYSNKSIRLKYLTTPELSKWSAN